MTTYVGKDVTLKLGATTLLRVQEMSFEVDNGQIDVREIGQSTLQEFNWTKQAVTGSMTIRPQSSGSWSISALAGLVLPSNDLPTTQPTDDLIVEFGTVPDFTITLTDVGFSKFGGSIGIEDPVEWEMPYTAKATTVA